MAKRRGKLIEAQKAFIVQRFAHFDGPQEVADAVNAEFGVEITRQAVERYDPTSRAGAKLAPHLRALFEATRKRFLEQVEEIPGANKPVRLRRLERMSIAAERRGNFVLAAALIKQMAEEVGNVYSNRRELTGARQGPIAFKDATELTDEEIDRELRELLGGTVNALSDELKQLLDERQALSHPSAKH